jgi:hypothetical protein
MNFPQERTPKIESLRESTRELRADFETLKKVLVKSVSSVGSFVYHEDQPLITFRPLVSSQPQVQIYLDPLRNVNFYFRGQRYASSRWLSVKDRSVSFIMQELTRPDGNPLPYELAAAYQDFRAFHNEFKSSLEEMVKVFNTNRSFGHFLSLEEEEESTLSYGQFVHSYTITHHQYGTVTPAVKVVITEDGKVFCVVRSGTWSYKINSQTAKCLASKIASYVRV